MDYKSYEYNCALCDKYFAIEKYSYISDNDSHWKPTWYLWNFLHRQAISKAWQTFAWAFEQVEQFDANETTQHGSIPDSEDRLRNEDFASETELKPFSITVKNLTLNLNPTTTI